MSVKSDEAIRVALGIDCDGMCCRHPNQVIFSGNQANHRRSDLVKTCKICESESQAGGVRQRKSFAVIIEQVQSMHANKKEWKDFKKNWGSPIEEEQEEEEKKDTSTGTSSMMTQVLARAASTKKGSLSPTDIDDLTRQLTLRLTQVQDWLLKEREKELEATKMDKDTTVSELRQQIDSMQLVIDGQNDQISKLQAKAEKQQKTINQELRMIKMIALKRASQANVLSSPDTSGSRKVEVSSPGSNRRASTGIIMHKSTYERDDLSGALDGGLSLQEAPPRLPERKRSEFDPGPAHFAMAAPGGADLGVTEHTVLEGAPRLPVRQASHQARDNAKMNQQQRAARGLLTNRTISLNNQENNMQPPVPLRVDLPSDGATGRSTRTGLDSHDEVSAITSSIIDESVASSHAPSSVPTFMSANSPVRSRPMPQPSLQAASRREVRMSQGVGNGGSGFAPSLDDMLFVPQEASEELDDGGEADSFMPKKEQPQPEISFMPTKEEEISLPGAPPPPPPSTSREIDFDASREFTISSPGVKRASKMAEMQFNASQQQLLFDASQALSIMTPLSVQHKTLRKEKSYTNRGKAPQKDIDLEFGVTNAARKEIEFGVSNVNPNQESEVATSMAQEFAANPDSLFNTSSHTQHRTPVQSHKKVGAQQEFTLNQVSVVLEEEKSIDDDDEIDDDFLDPADLPRDLPINDQGYLVCHRLSDNPSPVSDFSTGSYLLDQQLNGGEMDDDEEKDEFEPHKGLGGGVTKQLPMEADLDFDSESDDEKEKDEEDNSYEGSANTGKIPARVASIMRHPKPLSATPSILRAAASKGAAAQGDDIGSKQTYHVQEQNVQDKYGDGGEYTGSVSVDETLPHGYGTMKYDNDRKYEGDWSDGRWHGNGRWVNPNGDCYEGSFVYDARHGSGTYTWKNGNVYRGDFFEDKRQGKGNFSFANGNIYEGDFVNGVFEGVGRYEFDGGYYEGQWKSGRYHGHGFLLFADGSSYKGEFYDGVAHGQGEETDTNGTVRKGSWANGKPVAGR